MAGHSKWANIQHRKGAQDSKRGKLFTKLIRAITVAAKMGGGDPQSNSRLRLEVDKALIANMSKDTIDRAIKRGIGNLDDNNMEDVTYEGYGPSGVAVLVVTMTDNRNRTVAEIRHAFTKCGGNLGTDGSVGYLFTKQGQLIFAPGISEDALLEAGIEAGADDVVTQEDGSIEILTSPENFTHVHTALQAKGFKAEQAEVTLLASLQVELTDKETAEKMVRLQNMLEDLDDVQNVYSNASISDDIMDDISS
jgi:YebC/PmpR family DNA-binding regulatory protein